MTIDEDLEKVIKEDNPQAEAVKSLIGVKDREKGKLGSDIELKTDLDDNAVCVHTAVDMMTNILEMNKKDFTKMSIIGNLVNLKERKLLSKNRQSRREIVEVAKNPDMTISDQTPQTSFVKNLFRSRRE